MDTPKPLAIDLCCGKGGWTKGLLAAGFRVIGYDIEDMGYVRDPDAQLVLQDIRSIDGSRLGSSSRPRRVSNSAYTG